MYISTLIHTVYSHMVHRGVRVIHERYDTVGCILTSLCAYTTKRENGPMGERTRKRNEPRKDSKTRESERNMGSSLAQAPPGL